MTRRVAIEVYATEGEVERLRARLEQHAKDFLPDGNARCLIVQGVLVSVAQKGSS
jgi:hypothetical protein